MNALRHQATNTEAPTPELRPELDISTPDSTADPLAQWQLADAGAGPKSLFHRYSAEDAVEDLERLNGLEGVERATAIAAMEDQHFERFVNRLPEERALELQGIYDHTHDPERKLTVWAHLHTARSLAIRNDSVEPGDGRHVQPEQVRAQNADYQAIHRNTVHEIQLEVHALRREGDFTVADVEALEERKERELAIEERHGLHLTRTWSEDGRSWSLSELERIDQALGNLPDEHREAIHRVHRLQGDPRTGGWAGRMPWQQESRITITDLGAETGTPPWRTVMESDLSTLGQQPELLHEVITHEAGHAVHQDDPALYERFQETVGWTHLDRGEVRTLLASDGKSEREITATIQVLEETRKDPHTRRPQIVVGEQLLMTNPYDSGYLTLDLHNRPGGDNWRYATSAPEEYFAETYTKAVLAPESLYQDLVSGPQELVEALRAEAEQADSEEVRQQYLTILQSSQETAAHRQAVHQFFRTEVFGTDDSDIQALEAPPGKEAVYQSYKEQAAMAMTPEQLEQLRVRYADRL